MLPRKLFGRVLTISAIVIALCPLIHSRPQVSIESPQDENRTLRPAVVANLDISSLAGSNETRSTAEPESKTSSPNSPTTAVTNDPRLARTGTPVIGDSIKLVANQLLHSSTLSTQAPTESEIVEDVRTPPKMKNKIAIKQQHKNNVKKKEPVIENSHAGLAIPVTMEELEKDHYIEKHSEETSTSQAGLSTWILLSNPSSTVSPNTEVEPKKDFVLQFNTTEPSDTTKDVKKTTTIRPKQPISKNGASKRPQTPNPKPTISRRPIIASANKSDLIAGGSAVNENVLNKIKATVLANVQKNKNAALNRTTTLMPSASILTSPEVTLVTKNDFTTKRPSSTNKQNSTSIQSSTEKAKIIKVKKQKHKTKRPGSTENKLSAQLPMEAKEQEIELEVSTPSTTTQKTKRVSTKRKKNKTRKRKPSTPKPITSELIIPETKVKNNSKVTNKPALKQKPISTQIYNYLSREVMPTVGVGIVGLAGLVGLASYFLYPFTGPVRRAYDIHDKKDDLYRHNAEDYAHDGNGQAEEDMLGTVLAGIPSNSNNRLNPYVNQTPNRYPQNKKDSEQNLRYRNVAGNNEGVNQNFHYSQQKTGLAHGVVYSDPINYDTHHETDTKNGYSEYSGGDAVYSQHNTQSVPVYPLRNTNDVYPSQNSPSDIVYPSQSAPSVPTSYDSPSVNSVYAIKPSQESSFEPVYPFEGQVFSDTTHNPISTSMYLGSDDESRHTDDQVYAHEENNNNPDKKPQFVVGNVPKELIQPIIPAVVPEHGPRSLKRKKRSLISNHAAGRSIADVVTKILEVAKDEVNNEKLNIIDEALDLTGDKSAMTNENISTEKPKDVTILSVKPSIRTTNSQITLVADDVKDARSSGIMSDSKYDYFTVPLMTSDGVANKMLTKTNYVVAEDFLTNTKSGATTVLTSTSLEDRPLFVMGDKSFSTAPTSKIESKIIKDSKLSIVTPTRQVSFNDITSEPVLYTEYPKSALTTLPADRTRVEREMKSDYKENTTSRLSTMSITPEIPKNELPVYVPETLKPITTTPVPLPSSPEAIPNHPHAPTTVLTTTSLEDRPLIVMDDKSHSTAPTSKIESKIPDSKLTIVTPTRQVSFNDITSEPVLYTEYPKSALTTLQADGTRVERKMKSDYIENTTSGLLTMTITPEMPQNESPVYVPETLKPITTTPEQLPSSTVLTSTSLENRPSIVMGDKSFSTAPTSKIESKITDSKLSIVTPTRQVSFNDITPEPVLYTEHPKSAPTTLQADRTRVERKMKSDYIEITTSRLSTMTITPEMPKDESPVYVPETHKPIITTPVLLPSSTVLNSTSLEDRPSIVMGDKSFSTAPTSKIESKITDSKLSIVTPTRQVSFNDITSEPVLYTEYPNSALTTLQADKTRVERKMKSDHIENTKSRLSTMTITPEMPKNESPVYVPETLKPITTTSVPLPSSTVLSTISLKDGPLIVMGDKSFSTAPTSKIESKITDFKPSIVTPTRQVSFNDITSKNMLSSTSQNNDKTLSESFIPNLGTFTTTNTKNGRKIDHIIGFKSASLNSDVIDQTVPTKEPVLYTEYPKSALTMLQADREKNNAHGPFFSNSDKMTSITESKTTVTPFYYETVSGTRLELTSRDITSTRDREIPKSSVENISTHPLGTMYGYYNGDRGLLFTTRTDTDIDTSTSFIDTSLTMNQNDKTTDIKKLPETRTTESELSNEIDVTTNKFKIYEVFTTTDKTISSESMETEPTEVERPSTESKQPLSTAQTSTLGISAVTSTSPFYQKTTENEEEKTSVIPTVTSTLSTMTITPEMPKNESPVKVPETLKPINITPVPLPSSPGASPNHPHVPSDHNHKPQNNFSIMSFLKKLMEFKFRLGMSILQTTSESLARYLRGMENTMRKLAKASGTHQRLHRMLSSWPKYTWYEGNLLKL